MRFTHICGYMWIVVVIMMITSVSFYMNYDAKVPSFLLFSLLFSPEFLCMIHAAVGRWCCCCFAYSLTDDDDVIYLSTRCHFYQLTFYHHLQVVKLQTIKKHHRVSCKQTRTHTHTCMWFSTTLVHQTLVHHIIHSPSSSHTRKWFQCGSYEQGGSPDDAEDRLPATVSSVMSTSYHHAFYSDSRQRDEMGGKMRSDDGDGSG